MTQSLKILGVVYLKKYEGSFHKNYYLPGGEIL